MALKSSSRCRFTSRSHAPWLRYKVRPANTGEVRMSRKASACIVLGAVFLFASLSSAAAFRFQQRKYHGGHGPNALTLGDFNNDGKIDIAAANACGDKLCETNGVVKVLLNNGDGTFSRGPSSQSADSGSSVALTAADFDGDGNLDLAVVNTAINELGDVTILLGKGNGRFKLVNAYGLNEVPLFVRSGDFNKDGKMDIAVTLNNPPMVAVLLGNGDGTFQSVVNYSATGMDTARVGIGIFGKRNTPDIVALNYQTSNITVFPGNGDGTFATGKNFDVGGDPVSVGTGDLNGD